MDLGVRSFGNSLLMQNIFDPNAIPNTYPELKAFSDKILKPKFKCIELDCGTTIGRVIQIPESDAVGLIDLNTNAVITDDQVTQWIKDGIYTARVRDSSTCLSEGGFCSLCGQGYFARTKTDKIASVGTTYSMPALPRAYQHYVSNTYSGSIIGFSPLTSEPLSALERNWGLITNHGEMDKMCAHLKNLGVPGEDLDYLRSISNILERALTIVATYGVYAYAQ